MELPGDVLKSLNLGGAIAYSLNYGIEHFPPLKSDECLSWDIDTLKKYILSRLGHSYPLASEIVFYPRRTFGIRPIVVASLGARALYRALVQQLAPYLELSGRAEGAYEAHRKFGLDSDSGYIVDFDIASCYEYIDHGILLEELVLRSGEVAIPRAICAYLGEVQGRGVGLPQLSAESDYLADTYLEVINRRLRRSNYETSRYADDFRVLAKSFRRASTAVEDGSEFARDAGLTLSIEKTGIYRCKTLADKYQSENDLLASYFVDVDNAQAQAEYLLTGGYADDEDSEFSIDDVEFPAYHQMLLDWNENEEDDEGENARDRLSTLLSKILAVLRHDEDESVDSELLLEIANDNPSRVEAVVKYVVSRDQYEDAWAILLSLTQGKRADPWRTLWLIHAAREITSDGSDDAQSVMVWLQSQTKNRHQLVRAEAAWTLALRDLLDYKEVLRLYQLANELTRPLLAATLASIESCPPQVLSAVVSDSPLMKSAVSWAEAQ